MVDMRHVQRIVSMLLQNAIKFTPKGGQVGIELSPAPNPNWLQIVVWDTGIGISEEKLALLFEPFVQIEGGLARRYGGTGLGLALTSRLVRLLGARLMVESEEGEGSRFTLLLSRQMPSRIQVFADLQCPFCYVLSEWLEEGNLGHLVRWKGVELHPGVSPEDGSSSEIHQKLDQKLERLHRISPSITIKKPETISNTKRAMAALERIRQREPWRGPEARQLLYRAIWQDGRDVTEWSAIRQILEDFHLDELDDTSTELKSVDASTQEWRTRGEDRIPMLVPENQQSLWHGLGERSELMRYIDAQLRY
jgi:predicted DsbA family dithiol-disulfide isomerase/anti-sigma regulatory factor (Ser/Thr protein kinase)